MRVALVVTVWAGLWGSLNLAALVAQGGAGGPDTGLVSLFGNLGVMSVLVWHMWYHTTRTYPTMLDRFAAELEKVREAFILEQTRSRDFHRAENTELRNLLIANLQVHRAAVHDVRDTAQSALGQVARVVAHQQTEGGK